jgi:uncharacterized RDD family membrane protein YckC
VKRNVQTVTIETPDHLEIQFQLAGIGTRFLAYLIDRLVQLGILFGLFMVVWLALFATGGLGIVAEFLKDLHRHIGQWIIGLGILVYGIITIGYFLLFEYFWSGATPGKKTQGIRAIRKDGRPISFTDSAARNILRFVDILADVYPIGVAVMFVDSKNRRLGDLAAGTIVVLESKFQEPSAGERADDEKMSDPEIRHAARAMTAGDYQLITRFLSRKEGLEQEHRDTIAKQIIESAFGNSRGPSDNEVNPEAILEAMAALYRERTRIL